MPKPDNSDPDEAAVVMDCKLSTTPRLCAANCHS